MKLSVVILNYNVHYFLELCLRSVIKAVETIDAEIIVIDNNSQDDSCVMLKHNFPDIILIQNPKNIGFSKANNQAVKIAKGEYVCILNPDTVVAEDTFTKLLEFANSKDNLGIVGCRLIDGTGHFLPESKRNIPTVKVASQKMLGNAKHYYANHINEFQIGEASIFVGAFMLLKRSLYSTLNGFDEDFFMYGEDIDFSYRALQNKCKNYYFGQTTVIHFKGESTLKDKTYAKRFYGAMQIFYKKHFKTSAVFDAFVWCGIQFAKVFNSSQNRVKKQIAKRVLYSYELHASIAASLPFEVQLTNTLNTIEPYTEIIFDANTISYQEIIEKMSVLSQKPHITFKILPHNSNFIIGSNDSVNQGEIITFE